MLRQVKMNFKCLSVAEAVEDEEVGCEVSSGERQRRALYLRLMILIWTGGGGEAERK